MVWAIIGLVVVLVGEGLYIGYLSGEKSRLAALAISLNKQLKDSMLEIRRLEAVLELGAKIKKDINESNFDDIRNPGGVDRLLSDSDDGEDKTPTPT